MAVGVGVDETEAMFLGVEGTIAVVGGGGAVADFVGGVIAVGFKLIVVDVDDDIVVVVALKVDVVANEVRAGKEEDEVTLAVDAGEENIEEEEEDDGVVVFVLLSNKAFDLKMLFEGLVVVAENDAEEAAV